MRHYEWHFDDPYMEMIYIDNAAGPGEFSPACGISPDLSPEARRAREMEASGYAQHPDWFLSNPNRGKIFRVATRSEETDEDTVRALRLVIEDEAPDWIAEVFEFRAVRDGEPTEEEFVSLVTGIPLQAVVAISQILEE